MSRKKIDIRKKAFQYVFYDSPQLNVPRRSICNYVQIRRPFPHLGIVSGLLANSLDAGGLGSSVLQYCCRQYDKGAPSIRKNVPKMAKMGMICAVYIPGMSSQRCPPTTLDRAPSDSLAGHSNQSPRCLPSSMDVSCSQTMSKVSFNPSRLSNT